MPSRTERAPRACPIDRALRILGDRWSLVVIREVFRGNHRFEEIYARSGAPRDILAGRLRRLVDEGILERRPYNESATRFEYHLTSKGASLRTVLLALGEWGEENVPGPNAPWRDVFELS
jgi:DNA-binding HxlR family transcriptional regulator